MNKLTFLDRDGVICEDVHRLHKKEDLVLLPKSGEAIKSLNDNGYSVIVITNQAVVARGMCSEEDLSEIHGLMCSLLEEEGAKIDWIYYCPHHPEMPSDVPEHAKKYGIDCECRKPKPGMILQAKSDFRIEDLSKNYMVGDKGSDILAGQRAGCKTILVRTGCGGRERGLAEMTRPTHTSSNLYTAVRDIILK